MQLMFNYTTTRAHSGVAVGNFVRARAANVTVRGLSSSLPEDATNLQLSPSCSEANEVLFTAKNNPLAFAI